MIKACIFDLDGTIINTVESLRYSVSKALEEFGYEGITEEQTKRFVGNGGRKLIQRAMEAHGVYDQKDIDKVLAVYRTVFGENCTRGNAAYEGMEYTLTKLKEQGIKLAVISNKAQDRVQDCIKKVYGTQMFDLAYGERPGVPLKPDPRAIIAIIDELGLKPEECLFIGDGDTDMEAGRAAGCTVVGVTWGFRTRDVLAQYKPDYLIDSALDLLDIVK